MATVGGTGIPPQVYLEVAWGPGFSGMAVGLCLYGITLAQTVFYFAAFPDDTKRLKTLVLALGVLDTVHVMFVLVIYWTVCVQARVDPQYMIEPWEMPASSLTTYIITFVVQSFYAHRLWLFSRHNKTLTTLIMVLAFVQLGCGLSFAARQLYPPTEEMSGESANVDTGTTELVSSVVCDVIISIAMFIYFVSRRTDVKRSDSILTLLTVYTVQVGLLGSIAALAALILFLLPLGIFRSLAPHFLVSKCYVNSVLATLNARRAFRDMFRSNMDGSYALPVLSDIPRLTAHAE